MNAPSMAAVGFRRYGPAEVLETLHLARPAVVPGGVLVEVAASGVNPGDCQIRNGRFRRFMRITLPFVPGSDVAGRVVEVGAGVTRVRTGDLVYAMTPLAIGGGYAEQALVASEHVALRPSRLSDVEAAGVPLAALTALQALRDKAHVQPGQRVLVNGASGGVGTFAVQILRILGAHITGVCSAANADLVCGLGADEIRDHRHDTITDGPERYDVIFDARTNHPFWRWQRILARGGVLVSVNPVLRNPVTRPLFAVRRQRVESLLVKPSGSDLDTLSAWIDQGVLRPVIDRTYALVDAADAHRHSETGRAVGKIVLIP